MAESPEEQQALEKLDEATRNVAWDEFDKEADRERSQSPWRPFRSFPGPMGWLGRRRRFQRVTADPVPEPVDDEDPGDERGLRDVLRDADEKN